MGCNAPGVDMKLAEGRKLVGHKIGLTSRAMQLAVGIDQPDSGALFDDMVFAEGSIIPHGRFIVPRVEVELAFILGRPLRGPGITIFDVLAATEWVVPALEIIDARIHQVDPETRESDAWSTPSATTPQTLASSWGGGPCGPTRWTCAGSAPCWCRTARSRRPASLPGVLNHPANGIAWLANRLGPQGVALEPGQIVLAGSFTRPVYVQPGDVLNVDYGALGTIACRFSPHPREAS